ncbi:MAG TPA: glycosyltransferase family 4 protein [Candidatus Dormibacteraeota bacterium]
MQLVHGYPPAVGGVEFAVRDLCEGLAARHGVDVTVLTTNAFTNANFRDPRLPTVPIHHFEEQHGVRVRRFPVVTRWAPWLRVAQKLAWELRLPGNDRLRTWYQGPIAPELLRALRGAEADVISAASFPLNHMTYPFRRAEPRPPVVLIGSIHPEDRWGYERPHLIRLTRRAYATLAHTEAERAWLLGQGAPAERVRVIPLGIAASAPPLAGPGFRARHGLSPEQLLIAYVGQQGSHKGIDLLLEVLPLLLAQYPDARLVIAGSRTPYSVELGRRVQALPAEARGCVEVLDDVDEADKAAILAACDIFASPSRYESFGITVVEAWRQGRAVLAGDGPATRCVVEDGVSGLLVAHEPAAVLDGLLRLAADPGLRRRLGEAGRARFLERFTLDRVVDQYHEVLLAAREAGPGAG